MNQKIDFFNKNNKKDGTINKNNTKNMKNNVKTAGSKTTKAPKIKEPSLTVPKRRGRRPKKILEDITSEESHVDDVSTGNQKNDSAVILRLNIDPSKLKGVKNTNTANGTNITHKKEKPDSKEKPNNKEKPEPLQFSDNDDNNEESSEGMFKNDIPNDDTCHKCAKNEKALMLLKSKLDTYEKKERLDKSNKVYSNKLNFISLTSGKKIVIKKTNTKCWWDSNIFTNLPCVLPELFHKNIYHVTGCFCSFNCALAYNLYYLKDSKIHQRKSLIYKLYRELYGLTADDVFDIKEAPPKEILEDFGGDMSIDVFRRSFLMINKEYIVFVPPIKPINITIEERNIETGADDNDKEYVLKRSKPLAKKRSVMASMKLHLDEGSADD